MLVLLQLTVAFALAGPSMGRVMRGVRGLASHDGLTLHTGAEAESSFKPYKQKLQNYKNVQYHGDLTIGGQTVPAIFDTGSFELLVMSAQCDLCPNAVYSPKKSKTFQQAFPPRVVEHIFGSGPVKSSLGFEDVEMGPFLASKHQAFYQVVNHDISMLKTASFDAIVGLGPEGQNLTQLTLLERLHVTEYSLCLERSHGAPGWLTWGGDLTPQQKQSAASLPVIGKHHWAVSLQGVKPEKKARSWEEQFMSSGGFSENSFCNHGCVAIIDSGTSFISAPSDVLTRLAPMLPNLNRDCSNVKDLPNLEFILGGHKVSLPPEAYTVRLRGNSAERKQASNLLHFMDFMEETSEVDDVIEQCAYGFMKIDKNTDYGPLWIFGMPFFRIFHTTFRNAPKPEDRRILLMEAADDCTPQDVKLEKVPGAEETDHMKAPLIYPIPDMAVFNAAGPKQHRSDPVSVEAIDVRPPPSLHSFEIL